MELEALRFDFMDSELMSSTASTPGLALSSAISFKPYEKSRAPVGRHSSSSSNLLLHSSANPNLDYLAQVEESTPTENRRKHYIGVYDQERGELQLVRAHKLVIRRSIRSEVSNDSGSDLGSPSPNVYPQSLHLHPKIQTQR